MLDVKILTLNNPPPNVWRLILTQDSTHNWHHSVIQVLLVQWHFPTTEMDIMIKFVMFLCNNKMSHPAPFSLSLLEALTKYVYDISETGRVRQQINQYVRHAAQMWRAPEKLHLTSHLMFMQTNPEITHNRCECTHTHGMQPQNDTGSINILSSIFKSPDTTQSCVIKSNAYSPKKNIQRLF